MQIAVFYAFSSLLALIYEYCVLLRALTPREYELNSRSQGLFRGDVEDRRCISRPNLVVDYKKDYIGLNKGLSHELC